MTLGPTRITRQRWLMLDKHDDSGGSGSNADGATDDGDDDDGETPDAGKGDSNESEDDAEDDEEFKAITNEAELEAWKRATKKNIRREIRKAIEDEARETALKEQGNFKELYEKAQSKLDEKEKELESERLTTLRQRIGEQYKLTPKLISRLAGSNEKEITEDAKSLAEELTPVSDRKSAPNTEAGKGSTNTGQSKPTKPAKRYSFQTDGDVSWNRNQ